MTFQTALEAGPGVHGLEAVVIIDGIPVAFATRSGIAFNRNGDEWLGSAPTSLTTVEALATEGARVDGSTLNHSMLVVEGGGFSCTLKSDLRWDKYFDRRRSPKTRLVEDLDTTETGVDVQSSSGWTAGDVLYVDREAILVGTVGSNTFTGCTRVYAGLPGQMLHAHGAGAVVGSAPRTHGGRMAELWLYLAGNWRLERRLVVDAVQWDGVLNAWRLTFKEAVQLLDRQIAVGLDGVAVSSFTLAYSADAQPRTLIGLVLGAEVLVTTTSGGALHVVLSVESEGGTFTPTLLEVVSIDTGAGILYVPWSRAIDDAVNRPGATTTVRLVVRLNGSPALEALRVMLSTTGQGDNSATYDDLWGNGSSGSSAVVTAGSYERRFGAAISVDLVDVASFVAFGDVGGEGFCYWLGASGQENLRDFLEDVCRQCGAYLAVIDGRFTMVQMTGVGEYTTIAATLSDEDGTIGTDTALDALDDESEAIHTVSIQCNVDPLDGELKGTINIRDQRTYETLRDSAPAEEVTMRGLVVSRPERGYAPANYSIIPADLSALVARTNKILWRRQNGLRKYKLTVPFKFITLKPGDVVRVTCAALRAFDGGSLENQPLEVTGTSGFDLADPSRIVLEVSDTWASKPTSPTAKVASWNAGTATATLTTSHRFGGAAAPARQFALGWKVRFLVATATPPFSVASNVATVSAITDATITLTGALGLTPAAADLLVQANYDNADNTTENTSGLAQRDHAFAADGNGRLGASDANADEWG